MYNFQLKQFDQEVQGVPNYHQIYSKPTPDSAWIIRLQWQIQQAHP